MKLKFFKETILINNILLMMVVLFLFYIHQKLSLKPDK